MRTVATSAKKTLTIHQELAKRASIRKDDYEFATLWLEHGNSVPNLAILAQKYSAISAISVPVESASSVSSYVMREKLTRTDFKECEIYNVLERQTELNN